MEPFHEAYRSLSYATTDCVTAAAVDHLPHGETLLNVDPSSRFNMTHTYSLFQGPNWCLADVSDDESDDEESDDEESEDEESEDKESDDEESPSSETSINLELDGIGLPDARPLEVTGEKASTGIV
jgi:hypothetical protein